MSPASVPAVTSVRLVIAAVAVTLLLASLGQTIVSPALPIIVGELGGLEHLTWVVTAYLLSSTVVAPIYGKLGDLYGRKIVLQAAILIFLVGSVLSGIATDMVMLIGGRIVQGLGGGGLMVVAMSVVADVIPPRQRGKIQGVFGAVFGVSTIIGPLIGGFLVEQMSWPWIFFVNLPLGILALGVISFVLEANPERQSHEIDYLGAVLLTATLSGLVLLGSLGGVVIAWTSLPAIALGVLSALSLAGFIWAEGRASEPILPLGLFANNVFTISNIVGAIIGLAMFGTITFLPLFLQVVQGVSPTNSALALLPMMAGLIGASTLSGFFMTRTGRYKILPIVSSLVLCVGLVLLATVGTDTSILLISFYMFIVGAGIGPVNAVTVTAVQNAVPFDEVGVGTAAVTMFRQIGGSLGVSIFGALFASGIAANMAALGYPLGHDNSVTAEALAQLDPAMRAQVLEGFVSALRPVYIVAAIASAAAAIFSLFLEERPLSNTLLKREPDGRAEPDEGPTGAAAGN